ncbi:hypothetical protein CY35_19G022500 [Sphagnum magellanicum]|nr:hypothetical protein CY35_19G022500 [Sphagnum magellanicum]
MAILKASETSASRYAGSKILVNASGNILSMYNQNCIWTDLYFDEFASLPPIIPEGPIAILGLGGGTAARILLELWPSRKLEGWEIDKTLVDIARVHLGLAALESPTSKGGFLSVHVGDALSSAASVNGGFSGILIDLFSKGKILPQLQKPETWHELKQRLRPRGRIMVNCGGSCVECRDSQPDCDDGTWTWEDGSAARDATLYAMAHVFPQLSWRKMESKEDNYLALTGPLPDLKVWAKDVPMRLRPGVLAWLRFTQGSWIG